MSKASKPPRSRSSEAAHRSRPTRSRRSATRIRDASCSSWSAATPLPGLPTWERIEEVRRLATIVVATRPGAEDGRPPPGWEWERIETPRLEVSSTDLRARIADGRPLDYLLTPPVIACINDRRLYR